MNPPTDQNELDDLIEENPEMTEDLAQLLDEHDYDIPSVGDIRQGTIVSISSQGMIVDLGLKRDGLVQPSDLDDLEPEVRESLKVDDEIPIYIMETNQSVVDTILQHYCISTQYSSAQVQDSNSAAMMNTTYYEAS